MDPKRLMELGLSEQQARIYLKLLELGPSSVGKIIKHADISRISCYDTLNRLVGKGLVSFVEMRGLRLYKSADPERLLHIAHEKEQEARQRIQSIQELLPELKTIEPVLEEHEASMYKTKEGMKSLFELMLKAKKQLFVLGATGKALIELKYYFPQWHKQREKKNIVANVIFNMDLRDTQVTKMPLAAVKYLPKEYSTPSTIFIFDDYVANMLWTGMPIAFVIKSKEIAESYHRYFNILWNVAKQ